jgi:hypothetical protein
MADHVTPGDEDPAGRPAVEEEKAFRLGVALALLVHDHAANTGDFRAARESLLDLRDVRRRQHRVVIDEMNQRVRVRPQPVESDVTLPRKPWRSRQVFNYAAGRRVLLRALDLLSADSRVVTPVDHPYVCSRRLQRQRPQNTFELRWPVPSTHDNDRRSLTGGQDTS